MLSTRLVKPFIEFTCPHHNGQFLFLLLFFFLCFGSPYKVCGILVCSILDPIQNLLHLYMVWSFGVYILKKCYFHCFSLKKGCYKAPLMNKLIILQLKWKIALSIVAFCN